MSAAIVQVENLAKRYGTVEALCGVSFEVQEGEVFGLLGPNGAGKTTAFYMITGLIKPDQGRIELDGNDVTRLPMYQRARRGMGYLSRCTPGMPSMSVESSLEPPKN